MAKSTSGDRDWMEGVRDIFALLLSLLLSCLQQGGQIASPRGRGVPGNYGGWNDIDDALARPSASADLRISPNIDPEGQYNVRPVDQLPAIQDPLENIDADNAAADNANVHNAAADETDLNIWLTVAEVASLPRQIERDEANMMVRRPRVSSSVAESGVAPSSLVDDVAAGAPQHLPPQFPVSETVAANATAPDVGGVLAGGLPQRIEDEVEAHAQAQMETEVAIEAFPPGMLQLISDVAKPPQFATASMSVPAGDLESNLEERIPVDHPEAGDLQAKINMEDDVENLGVEEPHAEGTQ